MVELPVSAVALGTAQFSDGDEASFHAAVAGRASLMGLLEESALLLALAEGRAGDAQRTWSGRRTAVRTLEKLEERHDAAEVTEELRVEQQPADEVALRDRERQDP